MHVNTVVNFAMASLTSFSLVYFDDCINTLIPITTKQHKSVVNEKRTAKPAESESTPQYKKKTLYEHRHSEAFSQVTVC
jgi:hypothetical protein